MRLVKLQSRNLKKQKGQIVIPDFIVGLGYIDDASVVAVCCAAVKADLDEYREWCNNASPSEE